MKKFMHVAVVALALCGFMLTSCGSTGGAKAESTHPRSYTFDVIDGGSDVLNLVFNSYGPNYQCTPFFTNLVKKDKVQAGDTVTFKMKATTDVDLPLLLCYPCSTSPNWTALDDEADKDARVMAKDVKAGETFECEVTFVLKSKMAADFALCMQYDNTDQEVKTGGPCKLTLERVCESTDTTKEVPATPHESYVTVDLGKYAAFLEVATNHPWINGQQDFSVISNYEAGPEVTNAYADLPVAGDTMHLVWKAVSDTDIAVMHVRLVDRSAAANWWKELEPTSEGTIMLENIKAGEPFDVDMELKFAESPIAQVNLCIWYDVGDAEGPAIFKVVKD